MRRLAFILMLASTVTLSVGQQKKQISYTYSKQSRKGIITYWMVAGADSTSVSSNIKSRSATSRKLTSRGKEYVFVFNRNTGQDEIRMADSILATTTRFYFITTKAGVSYTLGKVSGTEWKYTSNGQDVVHGKFVRTVTGSKTISLTWHERISEEDQELVRLMCLVRGVDMIKSRAMQPVMVILPLATAIMGGVMSREMQ